MMIIKRVECDQFAGLLNKELELKPGLNIIEGENESGKSTLVDLIYQILFQDVKVDRREGFIKKYFPQKVSGLSGDVIDGTIVFETSDGTYKLKKEWETGAGNCRLTLPDGTSIKDKNKIEEILTKELQYRKGVYSEIVFASQNRQQTAVEMIMQAIGKEKKTGAVSETRGALTATLTQAALETGGVSLDCLEKHIEKRMNDLNSRWDWEADVPEGGHRRSSYKNKWEKGAGFIVNAYYEVDEVRSKQEEAEKAERCVEAANQRIKELQNEKKDHESKQTRFLKFKGLIASRAHLEESIQDKGKAINERKQALENWPQLIRNIESVQALSERQKQAELHELYLKAEPVHREYLDRQAELEQLKAVDPADKGKLDELLRKKTVEEGKLAGMNLVARITEHGSTEVKVISAVTGKPLNADGGEVQISEAVNISVPDIVDIQLMPKGVDVDEVQEIICDLDEKIAVLYEKYAVQSLSDLNALSDFYEKTYKAVEKKQLELARILGSYSWEKLEEEHASVPAEIEPAAEIKRQISKWCDPQNVQKQIGGWESTCDEYKRRYGDIRKLEESIGDLEEERDEKKAELDALDEMPEEFRGIDNPSRFEENLKKLIDDCEEKMAELRGEKEAAVRNLGDKTAEEYADELQKKEAVFESKKAEYRHLLNIHRVFCRLKEQMGGKPTVDIEKHFREYLNLITDGYLKLRSMDDKLSVEMASGPHALTFDILSAGTKDTISLAFRLAMLEHLFPEGDGLAVFDDPFVDMDTKRVEQSCRLIQKFAERNQVIFVTCDPKYRDYMSGNIINITR